MPGRQSLGRLPALLLKNWCFRTVVLEKTLESLLDSKEIKLVNLVKEINPEYSLEGLTLRLKLQYFGHLRWRADSLENTDSVDMILSKLWEIVKDREACCSLCSHREPDRTWWLNNNNPEVFNMFPYISLQIGNQIQVQSFDKTI